jgi:hypothetical protein
MYKYFQYINTSFFGYLAIINLCRITYRTYKVILSFQLSYFICRWQWRNWGVFVKKKFAFHNNIHFVIFPWAPHAGGEFFHHWAASFNCFINANYNIYNNLVNKKKYVSIPIKNEIYETCGGLWCYPAHE